MIQLFKPGYEFESLGEMSVLSHGVRDIDRMKLSSSWNGKTIELTPIRETTRQYANSVSSNMASIVGMSSMFSDGAPCPWELFPINVKAFMEARAFFISKGMGEMMIDYEEESRNKCQN